MLTRNFGCLIAGAMMISACGGDSAATPSPTPTPTPSSTPTPTPTPTPTYTPFASIAQDTDFDTSCRGFADAFPESFEFDPVFGNGLNVSFNAADESYTVGNEYFSYTYGPEDKLSDPVDPVTYSKSNGTYATLFRLLAEGAEYVRLMGVYGLSPSFDYNCVLGVPTESDDLPLATTTYSALAIEGFGGGYNLSKSIATLVYDPAIKGLRMTIDLQGTKTDDSADTNVYTLGTLVTDEPLSISGSSFSGAISGSVAGRFEGSVGGSLFGPQGSEAGLVLQYSDLSKANTETGGYLILTAKAD